MSKIFVKVIFKVFGEMVATPWSFDHHSPADEAQQGGRSNTAHSIPRECRSISAVKWNQPIGSLPQPKPDQLTLEVR